MSPSEPPIRISDASARRYEFTTHCCADSPPPRSCSIAGKATFTTDPSIVTTAEPRIAPSRVSRWRRVISVTASILILANRRRPCQIRVRSRRRVVANTDPSLILGQLVSLFLTTGHGRRPPSDRTVAPEVAGSSPVTLPSLRVPANGHSCCLVRRGELLLDPIPWPRRPTENACNAPHLVLDCVRSHEQGRVTNSWNSASSASTSSTKAEMPKPADLSRSCPTR